MTASHGSAEPGPWPAVPPNPAETPPVGIWPAPAASSRLMIETPPPLVAMTISVWTVPAVSGTYRLAFAVEPVALMVQGPGGIAACGLTLPGAASVVMSPLVPAAQLQWNVTWFWLTSAWITRTKASSFGVVRLLSMTVSFPDWALDLRGTTVYTPPSFTVRLTDQAGELDGKTGGPHLDAIAAGANGLIGQYRPVGDAVLHDLRAGIARRIRYMSTGDELSSEVTQGDVAGTRGRRSGRGGGRNAKQQGQEGQQDGHSPGCDMRFHFRSLPKLQKSLSPRARPDPLSYPPVTNRLAVRDLADAGHGGAKGAAITLNIKLPNINPIDPTQTYTLSRQSDRGLGKRSISEPLDKTVISGT